MAVVLFEIYCIILTGLDSSNLIQTFNHYVDHYKLTHNFYVTTPILNQIEIKSFHFNNLFYLRY